MPSIDRKKWDAVDEAIQRETSRVKRTNAVFFSKQTMRLIRRLLYREAGTLEDQNDRYTWALSEEGRAQAEQHGVDNIPRIRKEKRLNDRRLMRINQALIELED